MTSAGNSFQSGPVEALALMSFRTTMTQKEFVPTALKMTHRSGPCSSTVKTRLGT